MSRSARYVGFTLVVVGVARADPPLGVPPSEPRGFVAAQVAVGFAYLRPRLSVGYGEPHRRWVGMDANPVLSRYAAGGYMGLRLQHRIVDVRSGMLESYGFRSSELLPQSSYDLRDIDVVVDGHAVYVAWDSEISLAIPAGPGAVRSETELVRLFGVPATRYVVYEDFPVVAAPPWIFRQRLGYEFRFRLRRGMGLAPVVEVIEDPERDVQIWRAGITWRWRTSPGVELRAAVVPVISSPDRLGLFGGDVGELGARFTWTTR